jgi:CheY-like chemotaxis protein
VLERASAPTESVSGTHAIRVVVVDDEALVRSGFSLILGTAADIEVVSTATGGDAVAAVREHRPDVVLLDIRMPDVDGLNFADDTRIDLALALVAVAALALRRRFPLVVFLFTLPATLNQEILVPPIAAHYTLGERSGNRRTLAVCATLAAVAMVIAASREEGVLHDRTWTLLYVVYTLAAATGSRPARSTPPGHGETFRSARRRSRRARNTNARSTRKRCSPASELSWPARCTTSSPTR